MDDAIFTIGVARVGLVIAGLTRDVVEVGFAVMPAEIDGGALGFLGATADPLVRLATLAAAVDSRLGEASGVDDKGALMPPKLPTVPATAVVGPLLMIFC